MCDSAASFLYSGLEFDPAACCCLVCAELSCRDCNEVSGKSDIAATFACTRPGTENADGHVLKSSIKLLGGGGLSHVVRMKLEVFVRHLDVLGWRGWFPLWYSPEKWKCGNTHGKGRERWCCLLRVARKGRGRESHFSKPNPSVSGHPSANKLGHISTRFFRFCTTSTKMSQEATTSTLAAQHRQHSQQWSGMEDTVLAAAFWHGKVISRQQNKPFQTQTNYMAWGVGVQPHIYHHWFCRVSLQHIWFHSSSPQDV